MNNIEQVIQEMEQYVDSCKTQVLNSQKVIIDRGAFDDFITDLKINMPDIIQRSEKIVNNRDTILKDAKNEAEAIRAEAQKTNQSILDESDYVRLATERAQEILDEANQQAEQIMNHAYEECNAFRSSALNYALHTMEQLRAMMEDNMTETKNIFEAHLNNMNEQYKNVAQNHENLLASMNMNSSGADQNEASAVNEAAPAEDTAE